MKITGRIKLLKVVCFTGNAVFAQTPDSSKQASVLPKSNVSDQAGLLEGKIRFEKEKTSTKDLLNYSLNEIRQQNGNATVLPDAQAKDLAQKHQEMQGFADQAVRVNNTADISVALARQSLVLAPEERDEAFLAVTAVSETDRRRRNKLYTPAAVDSRIELNALNPLISWQRQALNDSRSVGLVIRKSNIRQVNDSLYQISTGITFKQKYNLCSGEKFAEQPVAGEGTCFLVSAQEVITAAHVITGPLSDYALVFGFEILNKQGGYIPIINSRDIYYFSAVSFQDDNTDLLRLSLNRVANRPALRLAKYTRPVVGTEVYMLGYPAGLPMKAAINASIASIDQVDTYYTSLDAFQGNSGSPVIDLKNNEVVGILVAGRTDFIWNGSCNITTPCNIPYCKGEKVLRIPKVLCPQSGM